MAQFVFVYLGGNQPSNPEDAQKHFTKYMEWLASLGDAVLSPMMPLKDTSTVASDGTVKEGGSCAMSGFSIISADTIKDALAMAQNCPFLEIGGSLEVSELMQMPEQRAN